MVKVIIVNGAPGAGKSTFEEMCVIYAENEWENKIRVDITSTVDFVKDIAKQCGWDGTKDLNGMMFLLRKSNRRLNCQKFGTKIG